MYTGTLEAVSNRQDWQFIRQLIDDDTGDPVDLTGASIVFEIREQPDDQQYNVPAWPGATLSATTENGKITIIDTGAFQVWFTPSDMQSLRAGYYDVGCTITANGLTTQLMAAELPVVDGIVSA
jgi:hypothetical protein